MKAQTEKTFGGVESRPFYPLHFVKRYWKKVILLSVMLFILLAPLVWLKSSAKYVAQGTLQISPTNSPFLYTNEDSGGNANVYNSYLGTQVLRLTQVQTLMAAINRLPEKLRGNFVDEGEPLLDSAVRLQKKIKVNSIQNTQLIALELSGSQSEGLAEMINSIITVFLEKIQEEVEGKDNRRLTFLRQEKSRLEKKIALMQGDLNTIAKEAKVSSFQYSDNLKSLQLNQMQTAYLAAQQRSLQSRELYDHAVREAAALKALPIDHIVQKESRANPRLAPVRASTFATVQDIKNALMGLKPEHPSFSLLEKRRDHLEEDLASLETEVYDEEGELVEETRDVGFEESIIKAKNLYETNKKIEEDLLGEVNRLVGEVEKESQLMRKGNELEQEYVRMKNLYTMIDQRIYALSIESQAPGRISLESIARSVKSDNLKKLLLVAIALAGGLSLGYCVFLERMDDVIRLREDVESAMGAPPSWPIEDYRVTGRESVQFSRVTLDDSGSNSAKAIRSLAVKLNREREEFGSKVVVFTGCNSRCGVSTIVLNTAHSLRQMMERVLVVDMNMEHANLAFLTNNFELERGVIEAVRDMGAWENCLRRDEERGVDLLLMKSGMSYRELDRGKFVSLLNRMKECYDVILIDAAPILVSDLSEYLVVNSNVVVPVIQGNVSLYNQLYYMTKLLLRLEVKAIAPVLNWTQVDMVLVGGARRKGRGNGKGKGWRFPLPGFIRRNMIRKRVRAREEARRAAMCPPEE